MTERDEINREQDSFDREAFMRDPRIEAVLGTVFGPVFGSQTESSHDPEDWRAVFRGHGPGQFDSEQSFVVAGICSNMIDRGVKITDEMLRQSAAYIASLGENGVFLFKKEIAKLSLKRLLTILEQFPSFEEFCGDMDRNTDLCRKLIGEFLDTSFFGHIFSTVIYSCGDSFRAGNDPFREFNQLKADLNHDTGNLFHIMQPCLDLVRSTKVSEDTRRDMCRILKRLLEDSIPLARQLVRAHLATIDDQMPISKFRLRDCFVHGANVNGNRFDYEVVSVGSPENWPDALSTAKPLTITNAIPSDLEVWGNPDVLALQGFQLGKNAIKAGSGDKNGVAIAITAEVLPNGCVALRFTDTGPGFCYDAMRAYFLRIASEKRARGAPLDLTERMLLSRALTDRVTPFALNQKLLGRGVSLSGGTGIGMSLLKTMATAMGGYVRHYRDPLFGVGVEEIIPNTPDSDVTKSSSRIMSAMARQMMDALDGEEKQLAA